MLSKQRYWVSKSFTIIASLKIKLYTIKNSRFNPCGASYSCHNRNDKIVPVYWL